MKMVVGILCGGGVLDNCNNCRVTALSAYIYTQEPNGTLTEKTGAQSPCMRNKWSLDSRLIVPFWKQLHTFDTYTHIHLHQVTVVKRRRVRTFLARCFRRKCHPRSEREKERERDVRLTTTRNCTCTTIRNRERPRDNPVTPSILGFSLSRPILSSNQRRKAVLILKITLIVGKDRKLKNYITDCNNNS